MQMYGATVRKIEQLQT